MKLLSILFIPFFINCNCFYKGSYSKVKWDEQKHCFIQSNMELGEINIFVDLTSCKKINKNLELKGKIINTDIFIGNKKELYFEIEVIRCDEFGNVVENMIINKDGEFNFKTLRDKKGFIVFKEKNQMFGYRYDIKDFK